MYAIKPPCTRSAIQHLRRATPPLCLLATLVGLAPAHAQDGPAGPGMQGGNESAWGLGLGVANGSKPYTGMTRQTRAVPLLQFENAYVRLQGLGAEVKLPGLALSDTQRLNFGLILRGAPSSGYDAQDAPILSGMAERKSSLWLGAKVEWKSPVAQLSADWTADASGHSKGQKFSLALSKPLRLGERWMLVPRLGVAWQDRKFNDYYFGVRDTEARPGRPAYQAKAGINTEAGLVSTYRFDKHHNLMMGLSVHGLAKTIQDSPLVDKSTESRLFLGYVYRF